MTTATRSRRSPGDEPAQQHNGPPGDAPGGAPAARAGAAAPVMTRRPGSIGPVRVQQLVLIELALALLLGGWLIHEVAGPVVAAVIALPLVLFGLLRRRGRPMPEWMSAARALKARQRRNAVGVPQGTDPGFVPAVECDPALRTYGYTDEREQREIGMIGDGTFLTAVVQVQAVDEPLRPARGVRSLPLDLLNGLLTVDDIRLASVQVVQHTQPAPAPHLPPQAVAARSYAPLQAQSRTPGLRLTWIAIKLDPELCPEAVQARGGGMAGARRALLRAADHLVSRLVGTGLEARVLSEPEIVAAVATSSCVNPLATTGGAALDGSRQARRTSESARAWRCDDRWHSTYWVGRWPQLGSGATALPDLVGLLTSSPALASTFSLVLAPGGSRATLLSGYVRLTGRSENELVEARRQLEDNAHASRLSLVRLDREQIPGVLATLPLGGTR
ncbi:type VII secretion protein EccE [Actinacidiphila glaucinigra]|uniref:Type VII secretion protein EccE n=1 Tax=Actinacidiphila glaucinigra TaxID=235986 RepID=A0A239NK17_9ACTN|nr:type VII secretion protein EccE [Actinacidiphila glaucinigra]SNT54813.1 type VII secretion protein EccE [Actinacidiphila glaucinigra]